MCLGLELAAEAGVKQRGSSSIQAIVFALVAAFALAAGPAMGGPPTASAESPPPSSASASPAPSSASAGPAASAAPAASTRASAPPQAAPSSSNGYAYHEAFFEVEVLHRGLAPAAKSLDRTTPQATAEALRRLCAAERHDLAAHLVDWSFFPVAERRDTAARLTPKLCYLLERKIDIDWAALPDRPDGQYDQPTMPSDPLAGKPRRSVLVGRLDIDDRDAALRLRRIKPRGEDPLWLVSPQFLDDVERLYGRYGPNDYEHYIPSLLRAPLIGSIRRWEILALPLCLLVSVGLGWVLARLASAVLRRAESEWSDLVEQHIRLPLVLLIAIALFNLLTLVVLRLGGTVGQVLSPITVFALIAAAAWTITRAVSVVADLVRQRHSDDLGDPDAKIARQRMTHLSIASRLVSFIILCVAVGVFLSEVDMLQSLSIALLSSAGAMGVLLGVAGHRVLGNLIAGLQIALTKPVQIGDCVVFEGDYGWVENLTYTYVAVRLFNHERLIVPYTYFLSHPIHNKSHTDRRLNEPIYIWVDARADVDALRAEYLRLVEGHPSWDDDGEEPMIEVVDVERDDLKLRIRATASDPATAWRFSCQMREKLLAFLREWDGGRYLPRHRHEVWSMERAPESGDRGRSDTVPASATG